MSRSTFSASPGAHAGDASRSSRSLNGPDDDDDETRARAASPAIADARSRSSASASASDGDGHRVARVKALSESESESDLDMAVDDDAPRRLGAAWSAYDANAVLAMDGEMALKAAEEREKADARVVRPKRRAAAKGVVARRATEKPTERARKTVVKEEADANEDDANEDESEDEGVEPLRQSFRISAPTQCRSPFVCDSQRPTTRPAETKLEKEEKKKKKVNNTSAGFSLCDDGVPDAQVRVKLSTGYSEREMKHMSRKISKLGGVVVDSVRDCNVFVTEAPLKRTRNVMIASLNNCPIVKSSWIDASAKEGKGTFLTTRPWLVRDKKFEQEHGYKTMCKLKETKASPFRGKKVFIDNTEYGFVSSPQSVCEVMEELLEVGGAERVDKSDRADFIVRLSASAPGAYEKNDSENPIFTPFDVLAASLSGELRRC